MKRIINLIRKVQNYFKELRDYDEYIKCMKSNIDKIKFEGVDFDVDDCVKILKSKNNA